MEYFYQYSLVAYGCHVSNKLEEGFLEYLRSEVEKMIGVPNRRIRFYTDQGIIQDIAPSQGRGYDRRYTEKDVLIFAVVNELSRVGVSLAQSKFIIHAVLQDYEFVFNVDEYLNENFFPLTLVRFFEEKIVISTSLFGNKTDLIGMIDRDPITTVINYSKIFKMIKWSD